MSGAVWLVMLLAACQPQDKGQDSTQDCTGPETCNGLDDDCDGLVDDAPNDAGTWYLDADGDGFGDSDAGTTSCTPDAGHVSEGGDCDDAAANVFPGAAEDPCVDTTDRDCDGLLVPADADADGVTECEDCDDANAAIAPGLLDDCDDVDNDCDGSIDEDATLSTWYYDGDGDGAGDDDASLSTEDCSAPAGYAEMSGDCDDADPGRAPTLDEICDDGIDQNCSGADVACGIWEAGSLSDADLGVLGESRDSNFGRSVRHAGDISGDGQPDLLIGSPGTDIADVSEGAAYVVSGTLEGTWSISEAAAAAMYGDLTEDDLGYSVSTLGDPDGDGYDDVMIGAFFYYYSGGTRGEKGSVYINYGPWTDERYASEADHVLLGEATGGHAGEDLDDAGDVNGDGVHDAIIGVPYADNVGGDIDGEVALVYGPPGDGGLRSPDVLIQPDSPDGALGLRLAGAGDMDGDGLAEIALGSYLLESADQGTGIAIVVSDPDPGTITVPTSGAAVYDEDGEADGTGYDVAAAGDVNGDGYADLWVSQVTTAGQEASAGTAYLVHGPLTDHLEVGDSASQLYGAYEQEQAVTVSGDGDLDGDGNPDLAVGAHGEWDISASGRVYVVYGPPPAGASSLPDVSGAILDGVERQDHAGWSLDIAGDVNEDGYSDLWVSARSCCVGGAIYLLYGGPP